MKAGACAVKPPGGAGKGHPSESVQRQAHDLSGSTPSLPQPHEEESSSLKTGQYSDLCFQKRRPEGCQESRQTAFPAKTLSDKQNTELSAKCLLTVNMETAQ